MAICCCWFDSCNVCFDLLLLFRQDPVQTLMSQEMDVLHRMNSPVASTYLNTDTIAFQRSAHFLPHPVPPPSLPATPICPLSLPVTPTYPSITSCHTHPSLPHFRPHPPSPPLLPSHLPMPPLLPPIPPSLPATPTPPPSQPYIFCHPYVLCAMYLFHLSFP